MCSLDGWGDGLIPAKSKYHRIPLEPELEPLLVLTTETTGTRSVAFWSGRLSSIPLAVLLLSSDGGVKPEAMMNNDLSLLPLDARCDECNEKNEAVRFKQLPMLKMVLTLGVKDALQDKMR